MAVLVLQFTTLLGTSLPVTVAVFAACGIGLAAGIRRFGFWSRITASGLSESLVLFFALAVWVVAAPQGIDLLNAAISRPGLFQLNSDLGNTVVATGLALSFLGVPALLAGQFLCSQRSLTWGWSRLSLVFLGAAVGLAVWCLGFGQWFGPAYCGLAAVGLGLLISAVDSYRTGSVANAENIEAIGGKSRALSAPAGVGSSPRTRIVAGLMIAFVSGAAFVALDRLLAQLSPASVYLNCAEAIGICVGLACALAWNNRRKTDVTTRIGSVLTLAVWMVACIVAFPWLVDLGLWLNAEVSSTNWLLMARGAIAALVMLPVGVAAVFAGACCRGTGTADRENSSGTSLGVLAAVAGICVATVGTLPHWSPAAVLIGLSWMTLAVAVPLAWQSRQMWWGRRFSRVSLLATGLAVVVSPACSQCFDPVRSAKLLFNSNVAYGYRSGLKSEQLLALDDGRPVFTATGTRGLLSVWSFGGHQMQIRENGLPRGVVSTDAGCFPRYVPETLQTVVPCVLHGQPERVLILGLGSGEALATAVAFPVLEIQCLEADAGVAGVVRQLRTEPTGPHALDDERVRFSICEPAWGVSVVPGEFDVVVSSPENLGLAQSQPYLTAEFYRRVANKLSQGGVFCQRLQHIDLGIAPIQAVALALRSAFSDVLAVEVAPGEMLFCATNDPAGLIRPGLASRLELPHVRVALGETGFDWTVLLNVAAVNRDGLAVLTQKGRGPLNTASGGVLSFALPREMLRWAPKLNEVREALTPVAQRFLDWMGDEAKDPVIVRRLAEVQGQNELMVKYADQFWAYRASLRDQVKEKPRSAIQLTSATQDEGKVHPEDRRRISYFKALSQAIHSHSRADIARLAELAQPYDPLITFFVHQEAAELYVRSDERDVVAELKHRLYATFFSSPRDFSLRNVIAGLDLLCDHPECEPDPQTRWDVCNALLQALKMRWEARSGIRPTDPKELINDADRTVLAAEKTFSVLDSLTREAGIAPEFWAARRRVLEKTLVAPVRAYQLELIAMAARESGKPSTPKPTAPPADIDLP
ncbi:MAG: hypothetical protein JSS02_05960 [Planctomycetes bacterium]|nr:hypothetical protein [Planctomycetota bacterium]